MKYNFVSHLKGTYLKSRFIAITTTEVVPFQFWFCFFQLKIAWPIHKHKRNHTDEWKDPPLFRSVILFAKILLMCLDVHIVLLVSTVFRSPVHRGKLPLLFYLALFLSFLYIRWCPQAMSHLKDALFHPYISWKIANSTRSGILCTSSSSVYCFCFSVLSLNSVSQNRTIQILKQKCKDVTFYLLEPLTYK